MKLKNDVKKVSAKEIELLLKYISVIKKNPEKINIIKNLI